MENGGLPVSMKCSCGPIKFCQFSPLTWTQTILSSQSLQTPQVVVGVRAVLIPLSHPAAAAWTYKCLHESNRCTWIQTDILTTEWKRHSLILESSIRRSVHQFSVCLYIYVFSTYQLRHFIRVECYLVSYKVSDGVFK